MAIYRGEGGATDVEAEPGNTEFAGGIIVEKDAVVKGNLTVNGEIYGDGSNLTGIPSVENTYTKDEIDASQSAQDDDIIANENNITTNASNIAKNTADIANNYLAIGTKISDAPDDGHLYGRKDAEWEAIAAGENVYTKEEINAQQEAQDVKIDKNAEDISILMQILQLLQTYHLLQTLTLRLRLTHNKVHKM